MNLSLTKNQSLVFFAVICCSMGYADANHASAREFWNIPVQVLMPNGKPANNIDVTLTSVDRHTLHDHGVVSAFPKTRWSTDESGGFNFEVPRQIDLADRQDYHPVLHRLFFIIDPVRGTAGCIGPRMTMTEEKPNYYCDDWGRPVVLAGRSEPIILRLQKLVSLNGTVLDEKDAPVIGATVAASYDLQADTHTGYGGEIWERDGIKTDNKGSFTLEALYPRNIRLIIQGLPEKSVWYSTEVDGEATSPTIELINLSANRTSAHVIVRVLRVGSLSIHGTVRDRNGKPVPAAYICIGYSHHPRPYTYADDHAWVKTTSDELGSYSIEVPTPWLRWAHASAYPEEVVTRAKDREKIMQEIDQPKLLIGGRIDFQVPERK